MTNRLDLTTIINQLQRGYIGFDPLLFETSTLSNKEGYPPYDIIELDQDHYQLILAIAGFDPSDVQITLDKGVLQIKSDAKEQKIGPRYVHKGIASRSFDRNFRLGEYIEVSAAEYKNGLLTVSLERHLPESLKARTIDILIA